MKKILHVISTFFSVYPFFENQFRHFVSNGYEIHLALSPSGDIEEYANEQEIKYFETPINRNYSLFDDLKSILAIYKYIKKNNIEIVAGHSPKGALIAMFASYLAGTKRRIYFRHGLVYETSKGIKKSILMFVERLTSFLAKEVVCVSPYLMEKSIKDRLTRKSKLKILNIGSCNGVDAVKKFNSSNIQSDKKQTLKAKLGIHDGDFVIGYVGRLAKEKGINEIVTSFSLFNEKNKNSYLLLIGPLEDRDVISDETFSKIQQGKNIIYTGEIYEDLEYYYSLMDIFLYPSYRDGFGNAIIEASSMEIPVLTTSFSGNKDAIRNGITGQYISLDPNEISLKIEDYFTNKELAKIHGRNGRDFVEKNFSNEIIWKYLDDLYK